MGNFCGLWAAQGSPQTNSKDGILILAACCQEFAYFNLLLGNNNPFASFDNDVGWAGRVAFTGGVAGKGT